MKSAQFYDDQGERSDTFLSALQVGECHKEMSMCVYMGWYLWNIPPLFDILTTQPSFPSYSWHNVAFRPGRRRQLLLHWQLVCLFSWVNQHLSRQIFFFLLKCVCCSERKGTSLFWGYEWVSFFVPAVLTPVALSLVSSFCVKKSNQRRIITQQECPVMN